MTTPDPRDLAVAQIAATREHRDRMAAAYEKCGCGVCGANLELARGAYDRALVAEAQRQREDTTNAR